MVFVCPCGHIGTLQCIIGKRGLPRLLVDGHAFAKKSIYKNKCFWYCKAARLTKCTAVCWTVAGRVVKWPGEHTHPVRPERINPKVDFVVPTHQFREALIKATQQ